MTNNPAAALLPRRVGSAEDHMFSRPLRPMYQTNNPNGHETVHNQYRANVCKESGPCQRPDYIVCINGILRICVYSGV